MKRGHLVDEDTLAELVKQGKNGYDKWLRNLSS